MSLRAQFTNFAVTISPPRSSLDIADVASATQRDYIRLHLTDHPNLRLSTANRDYALCRTYPASIIVPSSINDDQLKKVACAHKHNRLPIVTWCSRRGALLMRAGGLQFKNVGDRLAKVTTRALQKGQELFEGSTSTGGPTVQKTSVEHERYLHVLAAMSPSHQDPPTADAADESDDDLYIAPHLPDDQVQLDFCELFCVFDYHCA